MCGGTASSSDLDSFAVGLSPRVRGNPKRREDRARGGRSIPACAGEPGITCPRSAPSEVYPRVCGGTIQGVSVPSGRRGLSPRVRGNPWTWASASVLCGSIPACAGEPWPTTGRPAGCPVYPRVCGGTKETVIPLGAVQGLSPRVRGNLLPTTPAPGRLRSIPACAGEPTTHSAPLLPATVYPRVCGGTMHARPLTLSLLGLSPRVRGNRRRRTSSVPLAGSIPACAGEPVRSIRGGGKRAVYPRVCGGTW